MAEKKENLILGPETPKEKILIKQEEEKRGEMLDINTISSWNTEGGFGFTSIDEKRVFIHCSEINPPPERGADLTGQKILIGKINWEEKKGPKAEGVFQIPSKVIEMLEKLPKDILIKLGATKKEFSVASHTTEEVICAPYVILTIQAFGLKIDFTLKIPLEVSQKEREKLENWELEDIEKREKEFFQTIKSISEGYKFFQSQKLPDISEKEYQERFLKIFIEEISSQKISPLQAWENAKKRIFEKMREREQREKKEREREKEKKEFKLPIKISKEDLHRSEKYRPFDIEEEEKSGKLCVRVEIPLKASDLGGHNFDVQEIEIETDEPYLICQNEKCERYNQKDYQLKGHFSIELEETKENASIIIGDKGYKPVIKYDRSYSIEEVSEELVRSGLDKCYYCGEKLKLIIPPLPKITRKREPYSVEL